MTGDESVELKDGERIDDLQRAGYKIIQRADGFRFGTDAVLLADFTRIKPHERVADFGTGTGILPILLAARSDSATFDALEIQADVAEMAMRSVRLNGLDARINVHTADIRESQLYIGYEKVDLVVCNPPYTKDGGGEHSPIKSRAISRHEQTCPLEEITQSASRVLRNGGRMCVVFPAHRLLELCDAMRASRLEPKRVRLICAHFNRAPKLVLVEAQKNAKPMLHFEPMLLLYEENGEMTEELRSIYAQV